MLPDNVLDPTDVDLCDNGSPGFGALGITRGPPQPDDVAYGPLAHEQLRGIGVVGLP